MMRVYRLTDADGRCSTLLDPSTYSPLTPGIYRVRFDTRTYLEQTKQPVFYPVIEVRVDDDGQGCGYGVRGHRGNEGKVTYFLHLGKMIGSTPMMGQDRLSFGSRMEMSIIIFLYCSARMDTLPIGVVSG